MTSPSSALAEPALGLDDEEQRPRRRRGLGPAIGAILPLLILALWEAAARWHWVSPVFLPAPVKTVTSFFDMLLAQNFLMDFSASLEIVGESFVLGSTLGILLGIGAGLSRTVERLLGPTLNGIRHIPPIAWLPLIVLWVGVGPLAKVVVITKVVFFPVFLNTLQGIRGVQHEYIELARVLTLTRWQLTRRVILPGAMPSILTGVRYAASLAWAMVVVAEGLSGLKGLGFLIFRAQALLMTDQLLVCMVVIGLVGYLIDRGLRLFENHVLRWKRGFAGHAGPGPRA